MKYLRGLSLMLFIFALSMALTACGGADPAPESPEAPPSEQSSEDTSSSSTISADNMQPCKIVNVEDADCTSQLADQLTAILVDQGESEASAREAGNAIADAIKGAPVEKRNGFKMKGLDTGDEFSFLFQKKDGECTLQLFNKLDDQSLEIISSKTLSACTCQD